MKLLLWVTAVLEAATGAALVVIPNIPVVLLLGVSLDKPASLAVARLTGGALLSLGIACWFAKNDVQSRAAKGLVKAMFFYNIAAVVILAYAGLGLRLAGIALWPAVILHATLTVWCISSLRRTL